VINHPLMTLGSLTRLASHYGILLYVLPASSGGRKPEG
jgi:hypothetical protein